MNRSIYHAVQTFGEDAGLEGTTWAKFEQWARDAGFCEAQTTACLKMIFEECFAALPCSGEGDPRYMLRADYHLKQAILSELKAAKITAAKAARTAIFAAAAAVLAIVVAALFVVVQLRAPVAISPGDLQAIVRSNQATEVREVRLSRLQMAQILSAIEAGSPQPPGKTPADPIMKTPSSEDSMLDAINQYYEQQ